jgi:DNA-binding transcriptional MerR regulator/methylmalonyl-CoA mutase cobalamin-binding subunit
MEAHEIIPRHPIRVVAQRTGLTTATIRAWERRYMAVEPSRSEGGQRIYSDSDVKRLITLRELTEGGRSISVVADLSGEAAEALLAEDRAMAVATEGSSESGEPNVWVDRAYNQVRALDADGLERTLWQAAMILGAQSFLDDVVGSLLTQIGQGWVTDKITPAQEHLSTGVIVRVLQRLTDQARSKDGPTLVVATLQGELHGLGARLTSAAAIFEGWRVAYLGTDLPVADIVTTAESVNANAVAISIVKLDDLSDTVSLVRALRERLDSQVDLLLGGRAAGFLEADRLPPGVSVLSGLEGLRDVLRKRNPYSRMRS